MMSNADDYYSIVKEVNDLLEVVFDTESKANAWYCYPCYKNGLGGSIPKTLMHVNQDEARKIRDALIEMRDA